MAVEASRSLEVAQTSVQSTLEKTQTMICKIKRQTKNSAFKLSHNHVAQRIFNNKRLCNVGADMVWLSLLDHLNKQRGKQTLRATCSSPLCVDSESCVTLDVIISTSSLCPRSSAVSRRVLVTTTPLIVVQQLQDEQVIGCKHYTVTVQ